MKTLIVNNHTKHLEELKSSFKNAMVITKEQFRDENIEGYDLVVFSGGSDVPSIVNYPDFYQDEINFITNSNKHIIGICLGCEMVCRAFGGELKFLPEKEFGNKTFQVIDKNLRHFVGNDISCYESHMVGMVQVPEEFDVCVVSEHGPELIKHKTRPIVGIQFHPEVDVTKKLWEWLFMV